MASTENIDVKFATIDARQDGFERSLITMSNDIREVTTCLRTLAEAMTEFKVVNEKQIANTEAQHRAFDEIQRLRDDQQGIRQVIDAKDQSIRDSIEAREQNMTSKFEVINDSMNVGKGAWKLVTVLWSSFGVVLILALVGTIWTVTTKLNDTYNKEEVNIQLNAVKVELGILRGLKEGKEILNAK